MPTTIPNNTLALSDIPVPDAELDEISRFGHSFDGYVELGSFEACAAVANARSCNSLDEARACLFFELRRWRHFGEEPDEDALAYMRQLVEAIRQFVGQSTRQHAVDPPPETTTITGRSTR